MTSRRQVCLICALWRALTASRWIVVLLRAPVLRPRTPSHCSVDLVEIAQAVVELFDAAAEDKNINLQIIADILPAKIYKTLESGHSLVRIALATTGDVAQQKPIDSKPIPGRKGHGRSRISNGQDLLPISTAVVTSRTPSSPIRAAPIAARRRKGTSRRGYYRAQFESAWAATALRASHRHNQAMSHTSATVEPSQLSPAVTL